MSSRRRCLLSFICSSFMTLISGATIELPTPPEITTLSNRTITLPCTVKGISNPTVYWADPSEFIYHILPSSGGFGNGHRRYSYDFRPSDGVYNLRITNVQPVDDGRFKCILADTNAYAEFVVKVVVKPSSPSIVGVPPVVTEPRAVTQRVDIVTVPHGLSQALIKCVVGPSKPKFNTFKWFRNGEEIKTPASSDITIASPECTTDSVTNLDTCSSTLSILQPRRLHNGLYFNCVTPVPSDINLDAIDKTAVNQSFRLSVQYPPSQPIVDGYRAEQIKQPGDTVILRCSVYDGNPLPSLQWYRNGLPYHHEFKTNEQTAHIWSELVVNITPSDSIATYRCDASNAAIAEPYSAAVKFNVRFPPKEVKITGGDKIKAGESTVLSCTTSSSHPRAVITWYARGQVVPIPDDATTVTDSTDGGQITQTNITVTLNRPDNGVEYICQANNPELSDVVVAVIKLGVLYPPDSLNITGFNSSIPVLVDTASKLTCSSYDGNPLPTLKWFNGSTELGAPAVRETKTQGKIRSSDVVVVVQASDNGVNLTCKADGTSKEQTRMITVHFPPLEVVITQSINPLKAGQPVFLTCSSGSSNPKSAITWFKNGTEIRQNIQQIGVFPARYNGFETRSNVSFTPQSSDNGLVVHCSARNEAIMRSTTAGITLNVHYKPLFVSPDTSIVLVEGGSKTANFTAVSNPAPSGYTYFKLEGGAETELKFAAKRDGTTPEMAATNGILTLTNVQRARTGSYRVKVTNSEGVVSHDFTINVEYAPSIEGSLTQTYSDIDSTLTLRCIINANPPVTAAKWTRLNYSKGTQTIEVGSGNLRTVVLVIGDINRDDIGSFTCEGSNSHGTAQKTFDVTAVPFKPVMDTSPSIAKSAASTYSDGVLQCIATAYPKPSVEWLRGGAALAVSDKYKMNDASEGQFKFQFNLTVVSVRESDYGAYQCKVTNSKGVGTHDISLGGISKPEPPTGLQVLNVTEDSIILTWIPGFDGGKAQHYRVKYKTSSSSENMYIDANILPFTLRGLRPETEYSLTVQSINEIGESGYAATSVTALTAVMPTSTTPTTTTPKPEQPILIIILALAVVGGLLLIVAVVLIVICARRRQRKKMSEGTDSTSQSNTVEMYGTHDGNFNDDAKSYSTYEKGLDDDYAKHYEDDDSDLHDKNFSKEKLPYISEEPEPLQGHQTWSRVEDPGGKYDAYRIPLSTSSRGDEDYANELRNISKAVILPEGYQRPAFVAGRPPAPPPPGKPAMRPFYEIPPNIPERNYSPDVDYSHYKRNGIHHLSHGQSTPSINSSDDMKGHLV